MSDATDSRAKTILNDMFAENSPLLLYLGFRTIQYVFFKNHFGIFGLEFRANSRVKAKTGIF